MTYIDMGKLDKNNESSIAGKLLIATPSLHSTCFEKAVIYICSHDDQGAMGLIVNHMLDDMDFSAVLKQFNINEDISSRGKFPVYFGGPVDMVKGFILHSSDYKLDDTHIFSGGMCLTSNIRILKDITIGCGPEKKILTMGYAGWSPGQLEVEIESGSWFTVPPAEDIIFGSDKEDKWKKASKLTGILDPFKISHEVGHA
jgi:putative transcriptional regulator